MTIETKLDIYGSFLEFLCQVDNWPGHSSLHVHYPYPDEIWVYHEHNALGADLLSLAGQVSGFVGVSVDFNGRPGLLFNLKP